MVAQKFKLFPCHCAWQMTFNNIDPLLSYLLVFQGLICKLTLETQGGSKAVGERAEQIWIYSGMSLVSLFNGG